MSGLRPKVRLILARVLVIVGVLCAAIGVIGGRWGLLIVALLLVGLGAAVGRRRA